MQMSSRAALSTLFASIYLAWKRDLYIVLPTGKYVCNKLASFQEKIGPSLFYLFNAMEMWNGSMKHCEMFTDSSQLYS